MDLKSNNNFKEIILIGGILLLYCIRFLNLLLISPTKWTVFNILYENEQFAQEFFSTLSVYNFIIYLFMGYHNHRIIL